MRWRGAGRRVPLARIRRPSLRGHPCRFLPGVAGACPGCGALERHRAWWEVGSRRGSTSHSDRQLSLHGSRQQPRQAGRVTDVETEKGGAEAIGFCEAVELQGVATSPSTTRSGSPRRVRWRNRMAPVSGSTKRSMAPSWAVSCWGCSIVLLQGGCSPFARRWGKWSRLSFHCRSE